MGELSGCEEYGCSDVAAELELCDCISVKTCHRMQHERRPKPVILGYKFEILAWWSRRFGRRLFQGVKVFLTQIPFVFGGNWEKVGAPPRVSNGTCVCNHDNLAQGTLPQCTNSLMLFLARNTAFHLQMLHFHHARCEVCNETPSPCYCSGRTVQISWVDSVRVEAEGGIDSQFCQGPSKIGNDALLLSCGLAVGALMTEEALHWPGETFHIWVSLHKVQKIDGRRCVDVRRFYPIQQIGPSWQAT